LGGDVGGGEGDKEQNAGMSADEKKKEKEEKAKKEKEEKANKAAELRAQKEEQKAQEKAEKEEKKRLKEEERKNRPPKELIPKDKVQTYLKFLSFGNLAAAIAALVVMIVSLSRSLARARARALSLSLHTHRLAVRSDTRAAAAGQTRRPTHAESQSTEPAGGVCMCVKCMYICVHVPRPNFGFAKFYNFF